MIELKNIELEGLRPLSLRLGNGESAILHISDAALRFKLLATIAGARGALLGCVKVNGYDMVKHPRKARMQIGYVPSPLPLSPDMTAREYLSFVADAKGLGGERAIPRLREVIRTCELDGDEDILIRYLSSLGQVRLSIAQAMLGTGDNIILDDPLADLPNDDAREVCDLLAHAAEKYSLLIAAGDVSRYKPILDIFEETVELDREPSVLGGEDR